MPGLMLDTTRWPLILTTIDGPVDRASWDRYALAFERDVIDRQERIVSIFDMSGLVNVPDLRTRARIAEWSRENESFALHYHSGLAIVAPNPLARALMKVLHWTVPPKIPTSYEKDLESAIAFCVGRMRACGLDASHLA